MAVADLADRLRIPVDLLAGAGWRDAGDSEVREALGYHGHRGAGLGGVLMPLRNPRTGQHLGNVCRVGKPFGDGPRYLQEPGNRWLAVYGTDPEAIGDASVMAAAVENPKSALALVALAQRRGRRVVAIATLGCWGWRRTITRERSADGKLVSVTGPSPSLDWLTWPGRVVVIALDGDTRSNPKVAAAQRALAHDLAGRGAAVRIAAIPADAGEKAGPDDVIERCGDDATLAMLDSAKPWAECAIGSAETALDKLESEKKAGAKLDPLPIISIIAGVDDEDRRELLVVRLAALRLGLTRKLIERRVREQRVAQAAVAAQGAETARRGRLLARVVNPAQLLGEVERFFAERAYLPQGAALVLALWAMYTWCQDAFDTAPYICLESAIPGCGKSTVLDLLEAVCARAEQSAALTKALLARTIEKTKATMLFDQAEALRDKKDEAGILAVLLSGYRRRKPYRCLVGDDHELGEFSVFGPKAFCAVGGLVGALLDRCLVLHMEKAPAGVELESAEAEDFAPIAGPLRERLEAFGLQAAGALAAIRRNRPKGGHWPQFSNRERQLWTPLLSIARVCGPEVEKRAVAAAGLLSGRKAQVQADSPRAAKMIAIAEVLAEITAAKFSPKDLVSALAETEAWGEPLADKIRKDSTGRAAANFVGHFLKDLRLGSRERPHGKTLYSTAEALAKARQHCPHAPKIPAASAVTAAEPVAVRNSDTVDDPDGYAVPADRSAALGGHARASAAHSRAVVADAGGASPAGGRINRGGAADAADAANESGLLGPPERDLWAGEALAPLEGEL